MRLILTRDHPAPTWTLGEITVYGVPGVPDGAGAIYCVEDVDRGLDAADPASGARKLKGITAIPVGTYRVVITHSNRFKRLMPLLLDVPWFGGIRIHNGGTVGTAEDTEGCLVLGSSRDVERGTVGGSVATCDLVQRWIQEAIDRGETVTIEIRRP